MKITKGTIIAILIIVGLGWVIWSFILAPVHEAQNILENYCEQEELTYCTSGSVECHVSCEKELDLEYFKYVHSGFGKSDCWCKLNENETRQVW